MSIFSPSDQHIVDSQVQQVFDEDLVPDTAKTALIQAIFSGREITDVLLQTNLQAGWRQFEQMYHYAEEDGYYGLPDAKLQSSTDGYDEVIEAIKEDIEYYENSQFYKDFGVSYIHYKPLNFIHVGWTEAVYVLGYNVDTNILEGVRVPGQFPVYVKKLVEVHNNRTQLTITGVGNWGDRTEGREGPSPDSLNSLDERLEAPDINFGVDNVDTWIGEIEDSPPSLQIKINADAVESCEIHYAWEHITYELQKPKDSNGNPIWVLGFGGQVFYAKTERKLVLGLDDKPLLGLQNERLYEVVPVVDPVTKFYVAADNIDYRKEDGIFLATEADPVNSTIVPMPPGPAAFTVEFSFLKEIGREYKEGIHVVEMPNSAERLKDYYQARYFYTEKVTEEDVEADPTKTLGEEFKREGYWTYYPTEQSRAKRGDATNHPYLAVQSRTPTDAPPTKSFYNWKDRGHPAVLSKGSLISSNRRGLLTFTNGYDTDFNENGVLIGPRSRFFFSSSRLKWQDLDKTGFTLHYEIEAKVFDEDLPGESYGIGTTLGALYHSEGSEKNLGFIKFSGKKYWSDFKSNAPVKTSHNTDIEYYTYDFSVKRDLVEVPKHLRETTQGLIKYPTPLQMCYTVDVYINKTLWYTCTNIDLTDLDECMLLLSGEGTGQSFGLPDYQLPSHANGRIKNMMLIKGPVDPFAAANETVSCATVGDSNLAFTDYSGPNESDRFNNPLITGSVPWVLNNDAGLIFLNAELQNKSISAGFDTRTNKIYNASYAGWTIGPNPAAPGQQLKDVVDRALGLHRVTGGSISPEPLPYGPPKWWFCNMGINDVGVRTFGNDLGYLDDAKWATYICDLYIAQIDRMLMSSSDAHVFIVSPAKAYTATNWANYQTYSETSVRENSTLIREFNSRLPLHNDRVHYVNIYDTWRPQYHAAPGASSFSSVHFNAEGYRQQALALASIVPSPAAAKSRIGPSFVRYPTQQTGQHPNLDKVRSTHFGYTNPGTYFPIIAFRENGQNVSDEQYAAEGADADKKAKHESMTKMAKYLGIDYQDFGNQIHEQDGINDIEQCVMMMGVPITAQTQQEISYLHTFFKELEERLPPPAAMPAELESAETILTVMGEFEFLLAMDSFNPWTAYALHFGDGDFNFSLGFQGISRRLIAGNVQDINRDNLIDTPVDVNIGEINTEAGAKVVGPGKIGFCTNTTGKDLFSELWIDGQDLTGVIIPLETRVFRKQITAYTYEEIIVLHPEMKHYIVDQAYDETSFEEDSTLIPLDYLIARDMASYDREKLYARSLHLVFNSYIKQKGKWYNSIGFKIVLIAVAVVIAFYTMDYSYIIAIYSAYGVGWAAIFVMLELVVAAIYSALVTYVIGEVVKLLGVEMAAVLAVVLIVAALTTGDVSSATGFLSAATPENLLAVSSNIFYGISDEVGNQYMELQDEMDAFNLMAEEKWSELEEASKAMDVDTLLNPYVFIGGSMLDVPGETPDEFFSRTSTLDIYTKYTQSNIIQNYVDLSLTLPTTDQTLGSV